MNRICSTSAWVGWSALALVASAQDASRNVRGVFVEEVRNDQPAFVVRVDVDHADRVYREGDELRARVRSGRDGYLYLLYCDTEGNVKCLFPNEHQADNRIAAGQDTIIPRPAAAGEKGFRISIGPPFGQELLKALVVPKPLSPEALDGLLHPAAAAEARRARSAVPKEVKNVDWAEHHVTITTRPADAVQAAGRASRVAMCIGISQFADSQIRELAVAHQDAAAMAKTLEQRCSFDRSWSLVNEQATRANIEHAIRRHLPAVTRPGDTVLIYWSGHGSRCADTDGDEKDGFDEYLVPHDGRVSDVETTRQTMILDDTFGRWIQELDGRRVLLVLDTCHSGGQAQEKSLTPSTTPRKPPPGTFDFLGDELVRIKDIGQRETAVLASSAASQLSFERRQGDLSMMTHCLVSLLNADGGPLELQQVFDGLERELPAAVGREFPGTTQTPLLLNNLVRPLYLRLAGESSAAN